MRILSCLALGLALLMTTGSALAQKPAEVSIVINGQTLDNDPPPLLMDGRVLIPLRKVFNALGADVVYENKIITAQRGSQIVVLSPNVTQAKINDEEVTFDVPPALVNGLTYVPLRFVAQALGDQVSYDPKNKTILVEPAEEPIAVAPDRIEILSGRLKQLVVGNQGAILKVRNLAGDQEIYYRGLDDRATAPYKPEDQASILRAIELANDLSGWTKDTMEAYRVLPKREAIAFLGMVYSIPDDSPLDPGGEVDRMLESFLVDIVAQDPDVVLRRQAVLSMAVGDPVVPEVLESVLKIYETSENLWETFPVQQYFQYHAEKMRSMPVFPTVRARVAAVNSLYTPNILDYLDGKAE